MQSWSQQVDPTLEEADLAALGARLQLPAGWSYAARKLTAPLRVVTTSTTAKVLQDELKNIVLDGDVRTRPCSAARASAVDELGRRSGVTTSDRCAGRTCDREARSWIANASVPQPAEQT